jgi:hypothetical protein
MVHIVRSKPAILELMRRVGMQERIPEAQRLLPDEVDLTRDGETLAHLGLDSDLMTDRLGGSP